MPEQLKLENLTHNPPSYGFDTDLVDDLDADLTKFFSQFEELDQEKVLEAITNLHLAFQANISSIQSTDTVKSIQQNFRLFALLLNDRMPPNPIPAGEEAKYFKAEHVSTATNLIAQLGTYGIIPNKLNLPTQASWPDEDTLPPRQRTGTTYTNWKSKAWPSPIRNGTGSQVVGFFDGPEKDGKPTLVSTRLHLFKSEHAEIQEEKKTVDGRERTITKFLSPADIAFDLPGDLHADHLQPSENILARQLEMVRAMNLSPKFRLAVYTDIQSRRESKTDYFIETPPNNTVVGTKYFYMLYHNCPQNLWLLKPSSNSGSGKGNHDALDWLRQHPLFGEEFIQTLGTINYDGILLTDSQGRTLLQAAMAYFRQEYTQEVSGTREINLRVVNRALESLRAATASPDPRQRVFHMAIVSIAARIFKEEVMEKYKESKKRRRTQANDVRTEAESIADRLNPSALSTVRAPNSPATQSSLGSVTASQAELTTANQQHMAEIAAAIPLEELFMPDGVERVAKVAKTSTAVDAVTATNATSNAAVTATLQTALSIEEAQKMQQDSLEMYNRICEMHAIALEMPDGTGAELASALNTAFTEVCTVLVESETRLERVRALHQTASAQMTTDAENTGLPAVDAHADTTNPAMDIDPAEPTADPRQDEARKQQFQ